MNYIILSDFVAKGLEVRYEELCRKYGYLAAFDTFLINELSFEGEYRLLDRRKGADYCLIGKKDIFYLELSQKYKHCFFVKRFAALRGNAEFLEKLSHTVELPGEWDVVLFRNSHRLVPHDMEDISGFLSGIKASSREYYEFEKEWRTWDLYNTKRKAFEEKKEEDSERKVKSAFVEYNIFTVCVEGDLEPYREDAENSVVYASFQDGEFVPLGKVSLVDRVRNQLEIVCEKHELVRAYQEKRLGRMRRIRIRDKGSQTRLKRQREAMRRLFRDEAANPNLKAILMGEFPFADGEDGIAVKAGTLEEAYGLFGVNIRQREAYEGAVSAPDIYLIQGPPGTGKTTIITEIVRYATRNSGKVLVSSETHIAVDNVLSRVQYEDNVLPVRLGKEEDIEEDCLAFLPERIAGTLLANARRQNVLIEERGFGLEVLTAKYREAWQKKDSRLAERILERRRQIPVECDLDDLFRQIDGFETLIHETNRIYGQIREEEQAYFAAKERILGLRQEKAGLEEERGLLSAMDSSLRDISSGQRMRNAENLQRVCRELEETGRLLERNGYEALSGVYKRKMRRYERKRQELEEILPKASSLFASIHEIKRNIVDIYSLEEQRKMARNALDEELASLALEYRHKQALWEKSRDIRAEWMEAADTPEMRKEIEELSLRMANAVFATCNGIAARTSGKFAGMEYDYVIIDEAAKCNMLDMLIPIVMGKKLILVGDHKQLAPMLDTEGMEGELDREQIRQMRENILFKKLYEDVVPQKYRIMLDRQYRMERNISDFVSEKFYGGGLICEKGEANPRSMVWIDCENSKEEKDGRESYRNKPEAGLVTGLLAMLDKVYEDGCEVGVICAYKAQAEYIRGLLDQRKWAHIRVECSTVDAFQGREKHTIIFNTVRSDYVTNFLCNENRVNVAVSRAQEYLYVVGASALMKKNAGILRDLYDYIRRHGAVYNSRYVR